MLSIDDFVISNFNSGTTVTFPLYIFGASQRGIPVEVNVLATMLFAITVIAMALTVWQQRRADRLAAPMPGARRERGQRPTWNPEPRAAGRRPRRPAGPARRRRPRGVLARSMAARTSLPPR